MSEKNDGGPAFPDVALENPGMSLRDYFAAHALNSIYFDTSIGKDKAECEDMARLAYLVADAMLAERVK